MENKILKHLFDIHEAALAVRGFVQNKSFEDYAENELLPNGVERKFEIIGEALNRINKDNPSVLDKIRECRSIISFRNILIHGYDNIDDRIVWSVIEEDLENLIQDADALLSV
ncbi:DUF86 domain-containing protein [Candidatus Sumerlaeota bacterium]|nr:DUF86 domain-containing protein [Candidatus Sumerlaeota bacterium]